MRRPMLLSLLAATAVVAASVPGTATGARAAETCFGLEATITAPPGTRVVTGTDGDDVIVTEDVRSVSAGGGDDTLCLTGASWVDAGDGDDRVRTWTTRGRQVVVLGSGSDLFRGSRGNDRVYAERFDGEDPYPGEGESNTDDVRTGRGDDRVTSGDSSQPNQDRVSLGPGDDSVVISTAAGGDLVASGGPGRDGLDLAAPAGGAAPFVVDLAAGTATAGGAAFAVLERFQHAYLRTGGLPTTLLGTDDRNRLGVNGRARIDGRAGNDRISLLGDPVSVVGGRGRDTLEQLAYTDWETQATVYDLRRELFTRGDVTARMDVERLHVGSTGALREDVTVLGSDGDDVVSMRACGAVLEGAGGDDRLRSRAEQCEETPMTMRGGPGDDVLRGSAEVDVLLGGSGRDLADGSNGTDRCRAEVERDCERD